MLQLNDITVSRGNNQILQNLCCTARAGDVIAIVGVNGAGKSTLFDTIAGSIRPQYGTIILDGSDITALDELKRASLITRIFQKTELNSVGSFTVLQNLALALYSRHRACLVNGLSVIPRERARTLITQLGMHESILDKRMNQLSGGQRQLVAFAMATQLTPKILLLDEPTASLDPHAATTLLSYAIKFIRKQAITTLIITHDPHIALSIGTKIWVLEHGTITKQFSEADKNSLTPDDLIGRIDYAQLAQ